MAGKDGDVFHWCRKCKAYTPGAKTCRVCDTPKKEGRSFRSDLYPKLHKDYDVILEDGRRVEFEDGRDQRLFYTRISLRNMGRGGEEFRSSYVINDYDSLMHDPLGGEPDVEAASNGVAEMSKEMSDRYLCVQRYTTNPAYVKDLNRRRRRC